MGPLLRWAGRGLLCLYVVLMIVVLVFRYWLIPNVDQWRVPISQALSNITQSEVQIGAIQAQWQGWYPELILSDVYVHDQQAQQPLHIPDLTAHFQLSSLLRSKLVFSYLQIDGLQLGIRRDAQQRLHIAGQPIDATPASQDSNSGFLSWLAQQKHLELRNATLIWQDDWRDRDPIALTQVHGVLQQNQDQVHYELTAELPAELGQQLRLLGRLDSAALLAEQLSGSMYMQWQAVGAEAWRKWLDLPTGLVKAQLDSQIWLQLHENEITEVTLDVQVQDGQWDTTEWGQLSVKQLRAFAQGPWRSFNNFIEQQPLQQRLAKDAFKLELYAAGAQWQESHLFIEPWVFDEVSVLAQHGLDPSVAALELQRAFFKNADFELDVGGTWQPHGTDWNLADWDLTAHAQQIHLNTIYKYFPMPEIPVEVVEWLRTSLVAGRVPEAVMRWQGNLENYPYNNAAEGLFYVGGTIEAAEVDYYPAFAEEKGWPKVEQLEGALTLRGNQLWIQQAHGVIKPNKKDAVQAQDLYLEVDDFAADEPRLRLSAQTHGPAQAYLDLMTHSDLGALLDHTFTDSTATGNWQVPLQLTVNLERGEDIQVAGQIDFDRNTVVLLPELPPLEQVQGSLLFTEQGAEAQQLNANWLGGPVSLSQKIGLAEQALDLKGHLSVVALAQYFDLEGLNLYAQGIIPYQAKVGLDQNLQFFVSGQSSLNGMSLHLPEPLHKKTEQNLPLTLRWSAANAEQYELSVRVAPHLQLRLLENPQPSSWFEKGYLTWQRQAPAQASWPSGLWVDIEQSQLDLDQWQQVFDSFETKKDADSSVPLIPLRSLRIKADEAYGLNGVLNQLTYTAQQTQPQQWRTDISSEQVAGTVQWQENKQGQVTGTVQAEFQRVHWQPRKQASSALVKADNDKDFKLDLADLDLSIADFKYDAWQLGSLTGTGRRSTEETAVWEIPDLQLQTPHGALHAQGRWRLEGPDRGLRLQADLHSASLGHLLDYVGLQDVMAEGQGQIQAGLKWAQFPWSTSLETVQATVEVDLVRGRLNQLQSYSGKLLELLSLQSISRLTTLGPDLKGSLKNGFPFDELKGSMQLKDQVLRTDNFHVLGPVGAVWLDGQADISTEQIDLNAVVVPRVEMSGAALAAGIAVNPVVGLSAFLTQWLLKDPLAKAMTVQYHLTGPWDQVQTEQIEMNKTVEAPKPKTEPVLNLPH